MKVRKMILHFCSLNCFKSFSFFSLIFTAMRTEVSLFQNAFSTVFTVLCCLHFYELVLSATRTKLCLFLQFFRAHKTNLTISRIICSTTWSWGWCFLCFFCKLFRFFFINSLLFINTCFGFFFTILNLVINSILV